MFRVAIRDLRFQIASVLLALILMLSVPVGYVSAEEGDTSAQQNTQQNEEQTDDTSDEEDSTGTSINNESEQDATTGDATVDSDSAETNSEENTDSDSTESEQENQTEETGTNGDVQEACVPAEENEEAEGQASEDTESTSTSNQSINNSVCSSAESGDAEVSEAEEGGTAQSGDAEVIANIINILQSVTGLGGSELATFVQDIYGDQFGDVVIDPRMLEYLSFLSSGNCNVCDGNTTINIEESNSINNDIYLNASSGDATVTGSGDGGEASSGDATAILNLINIINSIISSEQTFVGIINIHGDLDGDILLPPEVMEELLGAQSDSSSSASGTDTNVTTTQTINNNVELNANTGDATVTNNGDGGSAATGDATTSINSYNLVNNQFFGHNALLVFVNVLGSWVGFIVDAPDGATSSTFGGSGQDSQCDSCETTEADINSSSEINNNININANTGDATVTNNGDGGSAATGDATSSLNMVNILNSNFSLNGWLGVLFINVFGTWEGSFGVDTEAGNSPVNQSDNRRTPDNSNEGTVSAETTTAATSSNNQYSFEQIAETTSEGDEQKISSAAPTEPSVLGEDTAASSSINLIWGLVLGSLLAAAVLLVAERKRRADR